MSVDYNNRRGSASSPPSKKHKNQQPDDLLEFLVHVDELFSKISFNQYCDVPFCITGSCAIVLWALHYGGESFAQTALAELKTVGSPGDLDVVAQLPTETSNGDRVKQSFNQSDCFGGMSGTISRLTTHRAQTIVFYKSWLLPAAQIDILNFKQFYKGDLGEQLTEFMYTILARKISYRVIHPLKLLNALLFRDHDISNRVLSLKEKVHIKFLEQIVAASDRAGLPELSKWPPHNAFLNHTRMLSEGEWLLHTPPSSP
jgi:hypothetical protein